MNATLTTESLLLDGNNLSLNFINTIHNRKLELQHDYITNKVTWLGWLSKVGLKQNFTPHESYHFELIQIRSCRTLLYKIFYNLIHDKTITKRDITDFNRLITKFKKASKFSIEDGKPVEKILVNDKDLNSYLLLIVKEAYELLLRDEVKNIKECGNCGWLFLDSSKNKRRKWCNMKTCGNEIKAKRFYRKTKIKKENK